MVPPRAYLPPGVPNYVTRSGMDALLSERDAMLREQSALMEIAGEQERRLAVNHLLARLQLLEARIAAAKLMQPGDPPPAEIRFGAMVTMRNTQTGEEQTMQITGVDEADASRGKISFVSPLARALVGKRTNDIAILKLPREERSYEILRVEYP